MPAMSWGLLPVNRPRSGADAGEGKELLARARVFSQRAEHGGGNGAGPGRLNAAQGHARVLGLDDHAYPLRAKVRKEPLSDLLGQPFLYLGSPGKVLDDAGQLG